MESGVYQCCSRTGEGVNEDRSTCIYIFRRVSQDIGSGRGPYLGGIKVRTATAYACTEVPFVWDTRTIQRELVRGGLILEFRGEASCSLEVPMAVCIMGIDMYNKYQLIPREVIYVLIIDD